MRVVDFFSGLHSWTKPWGDEHTIFSIDNNPDYAEHTTVIQDFLTLTSEDVIKHLGGRPDVLYASPPCTAFSVASIGHHWHEGQPKTDAARLGIQILDHLLKLIGELDPTYFWIENPRGMMRKMQQLRHLQHTTVWYCQYGKTEGVKRAKPTDLWGRWPITWHPRPPCKNGNPECDHVRAPRGAKTGTQGLKGNALRSTIPKELPSEIYSAILKDLAPGSGYMPKARTSLWSSPPHIVEQLIEEFGEIDLDPAANRDNALAERYYTEENSGLDNDWTGSFVYVNPPYGRIIREWVTKALEEVENGNSEKVVMLLPSRTDTRWFHALYESELDVEMRFIKGRLKFNNQPNPAPFPSMIVIIQKAVE